MNVLDVIPPKDCDLTARDVRGYPGVPLDWERCRTCEGTGRAQFLRGPCPTCDGHGSLKAAALAWLIENRVKGAFSPKDYATQLHANGVRCEGCNHPMHEGTWGPWTEDRYPTGEESRLMQMAGVRLEFMLGEKAGDPNPGHPGVVHYSPCDERCDHGGPGRHRWLDEDYLTFQATDALQAARKDYEREASWRQVDVRPLGHPCDLRPHMLAALCLRCYAERSR